MKLNSRNKIRKQFNNNDIYNDIINIINQSRQTAYRSIDIILLKRNWMIGKRIKDEELKDKRKENYGLEIIKNLSKKLTRIYGTGFSQRNLYYFYKFYLEYKDILQTLSAQSLLGWSHYVLLLGIEDKKARSWYEQEAHKYSWSVRTLQRNINTQYYYRIMSSQLPELVRKEMEEKVSDFQKDKFEHIKNPVILEFLGLKQEENLLESSLESAIISNIQKMLIELGKGYAFVGRQYHIHTEYSDYYVDLVFYNYLLNCFVLIDLKTNKITHQDVGQMDMYVRMFDELIKKQNDNPTLGIVLCSETDEDIAKYSMLKGNEQLFATKYKLYLPNENDLKAEIDYQKEIYCLQLKK